MKPIKPQVLITYELKIITILTDIVWFYQNPSKIYRLKNKVSGHMTQLLKCLILWIPSIFDRCQSSCFVLSNTNGDIQQVNIALITLKNILKSQTG